MLKIRHVLIMLIAQSIGLAGVANAQSYGSYGQGIGRSYHIIPGSDYRQPIPRDGSNQRYTAVDALYEKASDARWAKNHAAAFQIYNKIISLDPRSAQAYFSRGVIKEERMNDRIGALSDYQMAAKLFKQEGDSYMIRASSENIERLTR
jgi:tetratricopeptide (TPR) repeat protein